MSITFFLPQPELRHLYR